MLNVGSTELMLGAEIGIEMLNVSERGIEWMLDVEIGLNRYK